MKAFILIIITLINFPSLAESEWRLIRDEDNIQVYSRSSNDSVIHSVKGVVHIATSLDKLLGVFEDITDCPNWMHQCKSATTLEQINIVERVDYILMNLPWPTWDRDLVIYSLFQQDRNTKAVEIKFHTVPKRVPVKSGIVRVKKMTAIMKFVPQKNGDIQFSYEISVDPRGKIPKWLVNAMAVDFPFYTLQKVRALVEKH